jgi:hypothetical protein
VPHLLGIEIGSGSTRAAVRRRTTDHPVWGLPEPLPDGPGAGGLLGLVGDDVPVPTADGLVAPHVLVAGLARDAVDTAWGIEGELPERVAFACPSGWGPGRADLMRAALEDAGCGDVALVARACATVERYRAAGRLPDPGRPVAVLRIGGSGVEVSLAVPHTPGRMELLGSAELDWICADDLAGVEPAEARSAMAAVVDLLGSAVRACGLTSPEVAAVLTAGGGTGYPVVGEVLAATVAVPVLRDGEARSTVACGAALSIRPPDPPPARAVELSPARSGSRAVTVSTHDVEPAVDAMPARPPLRVPALRVGGR